MTPTRSPHATARAAVPPGPHRFPAQTGALRATVLGKPHAPFPAVQAGSIAPDSRLFARKFAPSPIRWVAHECYAHGPSCVAGLWGRCEHCAAGRTTSGICVVGYQVAVRFHHYTWPAPAGDSAHLSARDFLTSPYSLVFQHHFEPGLAEAEEAARSRSMTGHLQSEAPLSGAHWADHISPMLWAAIYTARALAGR